jgi:hypothetical protein
MVSAVGEAGVLMAVGLRINLDSAVVRNTCSNASEPSLRAAELRPAAQFTPRAGF